MAPTIFPANREEVLHKFRCAGEIFANLGVPLIDEEMLELAGEHRRRAGLLQHIHRQREPQGPVAQQGKYLPQEQKCEVSGKQLLTGGSSWWGWT